MAFDGALPIAVVVPARDEAHSIDALLQSLLEQSRAAAEIVVVDAGSRDDTAERVRRWAERCASVRLVTAGPAYPGEARNIGIAATTQEWVALTDAGIRVDREWLSELWRARGEGAEVVFGHYEPALRGWLSECAALSYVAPCIPVDGQPWRGDSFASVLLQRSVWERCGGFPPFRAAEDLIFLEAIREAECGCTAAPAARVQWQLPSDVSSTWRRFTSYSRHNLVAGRARHWHRGVVRLWVGAAIIAAAGAALSPVCWSLLPLAVGARACRAIAHRRYGSGVRDPFRPDRIAGVAFLQTMLDLATFWGALIWLREDRQPVRRGDAAARRSGIADPSAAGQPPMAHAPRTRPATEVPPRADAGYPS